MDEFFRTRMGQRFFEHSVPEIATQLKRIADALEDQNKLRKDEYNLAADKHVTESVCDHGHPKMLPCALCIHQAHRAEEIKAGCLCPSVVDRMHDCPVHAAEVEKKKQHSDTQAWVDWFTGPQAGVCKTATLERMAAEQGLPVIVLNAPVDEKLRELLDRLRELDKRVCPHGDEEG